jgi:aldehyde dehydrogenase (NAD+)/betaine-aldehyde dehydrogenase
VAPAERCRILDTVARVFRENADRTAGIEVAGSGKTLAEAQGDVQSSAHLFE